MSRDKGIVMLSLGLVLRTEGVAVMGPLVIETSLFDTCVLFRIKTSRVTVTLPIGKFQFGYVRVTKSIHITEV